MALVSYKVAQEIKPLSFFTRDASYHDLEKLSEKQRRVYAIIHARGPVSNRMIARLLGWEINRVTPRVKELREAELVIMGGTVYDKETQRQVVAWRTTT